MPWEPLEEPTKEETSRLLREYKKKACFLVDESLGIGVTELLREAGWNVKDVTEVGLARHPDEDVFSYAYRNNRILLTHDDDFLDNRRFPLQRNPGIVVLPGASGSESVLLRALGGMLSIIGHFRDLYAEKKVKIAEDGIWTEIHLTKSGAIETEKYKFPKHGMPLRWANSAEQFNKKATHRT